MTLRFSPALQNFIATQGSWKNFFDQGSIEIYTGAQPATPDLAVMLEHAQRRTKLEAGSKLVRAGIGADCFGRIEDIGGYGSGC